MRLSTSIKVFHLRKFAKGVSASQFNSDAKKRLGRAIKIIQEKAAEMAPYYSGALRTDLLSPNARVIVIEPNKVRAYLKFTGESAAYGLVQERGTNTIGAKQAIVNVNAVPPLQRLMEWCAVTFGRDIDDPELKRIAKSVQWNIKLQGIPSNPAKFDKRYFIKRAMASHKWAMKYAVQKWAGKAFGDVIMNSMMAAIPSQGAVSHGLISSGDK